MNIRLENPIYAEKLRRQITKKQYNRAGKFFLQKHFDLTEFALKAIFHTMDIRLKEIQSREKNDYTPDISVRPLEVSKKSQNLRKEYHYESQNRGYLYRLRPLR